MDAARIATRFGVAARRRDNWVHLVKFALVVGSGYLVNPASHLKSAKVNKRLV